MDETETASALAQLNNGDYPITAHKAGRYRFHFVDENSGDVVEVSFDVLLYHHREFVVPDKFSSYAVSVGR